MDKTTMQAVAWGALVGAALFGYTQAGGEQAVESKDQRAERQMRDTRKEYKQWLASHPNRKAQRFSAATRWVHAGRENEVVRIPAHVRRVRVSVEFTGKHATNFHVLCGPPEAKGGIGRVLVNTMLTDERRGYVKEVAGINTLSRESCRFLTVGGDEVKWTLRETARG